MAEVVQQDDRGVAAGLPVMDLPGWVEPPVWYSPRMGMDAMAEPGRGGQRRCGQAAIAAVESAVHHTRVQRLVVGRGFHPPASIVSVKPGVKRHR